MTIQFDIVYVYLGLPQIYPPQEESVGRPTRSAYGTAVAGGSERISAEGGSYGGHHGGTVIDPRELLAIALRKTGLYGYRMRTSLPLAEDA